MTTQPCTSAHLQLYELRAKAFIAGLLHLLPAAHGVSSPKGQLQDVWGEEELGWWSQQWETARKADTSQCGTQALLESSSLFYRHSTGFFTFFAPVGGAFLVHHSGSRQQRIRYKNRALTFQNKNLIDLRHKEEEEQGKTKFVQSQGGSG